MIRKSYDGGTARQRSGSACRVRRTFSSCSQRLGACRTGYIGYTLDMYFLTKLRTMLLGMLRSMRQSTSEEARDSDFLRLSLGLPDATAVDGVKLIRTRAIRSVMPGPEGNRANIMACISPQPIISARSGSWRGTTGASRSGPACLGEGLGLK